MPRPPKLSPASYLRLLSVGEKGEVSGEPVPPDELTATADHGFGGCIEACVMYRGRPVLRIEIDPSFFARREVAWFVRLVERIAERRKSRLRAV